MTPQENDAIMAYLSSIDNRVGKMDEKVDALTDKINGYHGDTVGTRDCQKCRAGLVDKNFFLGALSALGALVTALNVWGRITP